MRGQVRTQWTRARQCGFALATKSGRLGRLHGGTEGSHVRRRQALAAGIVAGQQEVPLHLRQAAYGCLALLGACNAQQRDMASDST